MHYLAQSMTKLCQGRKQRFESWEGISIYDCFRKEGVFIVILKCGYLSVCQRVAVSGLPTVWCEIIGGWDHLALFSLRTESDNPDATCELSP